MRNEPSSTTPRRLGVPGCAAAVLLATVCAVLCAVVAGWTWWTAMITVDLAVAVAGLIVIARDRHPVQGRSSTFVATVVVVVAVLVVATAVATWRQIAAVGAGDGAHGSVVRSRCAIGT